MSAKQYRRKPIVIEATQWFENGDHPEDDVWRPYEDTGKIPSEPREGNVVRHYLRPHDSREDVCRYCGATMGRHGWIDTLEGGHIVCPGDWIITGVQGERYACKPDVFEATYEPVTAEGDELGQIRG